jgi:hypothetical protein
MHSSKPTFAVQIAVAFLCLQVAIPAALAEAPNKTAGIETVLWRNPVDIASRDLFYGSGGRENVPHGPFVFLDEDLNGTNPKFHVRDRDGIKWQVKLGKEARSETAASRLVWAVGYPTTDDYFIPELRVENMPAHLRRGQNLVAPDGTMRDVRLKRNPGMIKVGLWRWRANPFVATREYNGLRVIMALINNWDLKDENNTIYREEDSEGLKSPEELYMVTDLGASFGSAGRSWPARKSRGNLESYARSKFIRKVTLEKVDFDFPTRPALIYLVGMPAFVHRLGLRRIGKNIPRADAKWIGQLLALLSGDQISDAFRASGYTTAEVEGFTQVVLKRIAALNGL